MRCPKCKTDIDKVKVTSKCWQWGYLEPEDSLDPKKIKEYGSVEDILDTLKIECPNCGANLTHIVEE